MKALKLDSRRKGQRCTSWLKERQLIIELDAREMAANLHRKRGQSIEVFKAGVEGVFPFLQQNIRR